LSGRFGTESYAKEELKAEFASVFIGQEKGLNYNERHLENSNAYLQSWINVLKNEPNEIFTASKEADKISTHVLKYEKEKQPKIEKSLKKEMEISL
ncbi:MAG: zincin-like metallopeptidase domain-containing protein, partial [Cetobacterium sp.]